MWRVIFFEGNSEMENNFWAPYPPLSTFPPLPSCIKISSKLAVEGEAPPPPRPAAMVLPQRVRWAWLRQALAGPCPSRSCLVRPIFVGRIGVTKLRGLRPCGGKVQPLPEALRYLVQIAPMASSLTRKLRSAVSVRSCSRGTFSRASSIRFLV